MSGSDYNTLILKRNRQFKFLFGAFAPLAAILLYVAINGLVEVGVITHGVSDEDEQCYHLVAPYVYGFFLLMLIIFFGKMYFESLAPILKDIKANKKLLLYYIPEKTDMSAFGRYFLSTPVFAKQQTEVSKEDFLSIPNGAEVAVEVTPKSNIVLRFTCSGREIVVK